MSNCALITCENENEIPRYTGGFSLQNALIFKNTEMTFETTGGTVTIPDGTIIIPVPSDPSFITYKGCQSVVTIPVPAGATAEQIADIVDQVMYQVAEQQAQCDAGAVNPATPPIDGGDFPTGSGGSGGTGGGGASAIYLSAQQSVALACDYGTRTFPSLGGGLSIVGSNLVLAAGFFTDSTQEAANQSALDYITAAAAISANFCICQTIAEGVWLYTPNPNGTGSSTGDTGTINLPVGGSGGKMRITFTAAAAGIKYYVVAVVNNPNGAYCSGSVGFYNGGSLIDSLNIPASTDLSRTFTQIFTTNGAGTFAVEAAITNGFPSGPALSMATTVACV